MTRTNQSNVSQLKKITAAKISLIKKRKDKIAIEKVKYIYISTIPLDLVSSIKNQNQNCNYVN